MLVLVSEDHAVLVLFPVSNVGILEARIPKELKQIPGVSVAGGLDHNDFLTRAMAGVNIENHVYS